MDGQNTGDFLQDLGVLELFCFELLWHDDEAIVNRPHFPSELDLKKYPDDNLHQISVMVECRLTVAKSNNIFAILTIFTNYKTASSLNNWKIVLAR